MQETIISCLPFAVFPNEVHLLWKDIRLRKKNFVQETRISDRYCFLIWLLIRIKYRYCLTELYGFLNITFHLYSLTNNFALVVVLFVFIRFVLVRYHSFFIWIDIMVRYSSCLVRSKWKKNLRSLFFDWSVLRNSWFRSIPYCMYFLYFLCLRKQEIYI